MRLHFKTVRPERAHTQFCFVPRLDGVVMGVVVGVSTFRDKGCVDMLQQSWPLLYKGKVNVCN